MNNKSWWSVMWVTLILWNGTPFAYGQKATELFIPVGQSPGLSNTVTVIGTIENIDTQRRLLILRGTSATWRTTITDRTRIWLDRSKLRLTNQKGTFVDLREGLLVEVRYEDLEGKKTGQGPADWIKVQVTKSSPRGG